MSLAYMIGALYRALHPCEESVYGAAAWFRRELEAQGVKVSPATISNWVNNAVPEHRIPEVSRVIEALHRTAHKQAVAQLHAVEAIPGWWR